MPITRKSLFGFPPAPRQGSQYTQREVPLSQGINSTTAWPLQAPGSAASMVNFLPLDGVLVPRSKLSSLNTIRSLSTIYGMAPVYYGNGVTAIWASGSTCHAYLASNGSMSRASFVSSFGLGVTGIQSASLWQYAQAFSADLNEYMLIAANNSKSTLQCVYLSTGASGVARYSYLTSAPQAYAVGAFDNYLLAWNLTEGSASFPNRVRWCVRGLPSNWTGEGSGFEDLLAVRGRGQAIIGTNDNRILLFTDRETWYGVGAAYPAQFTFYPLDTSIGCLHAKTIQETEFGVVCLGTDSNLRLFPRGGGLSQVVAPTLGKVLRRIGGDAVDTNFSSCWAVYDTNTKLYYLYAPGLGSTPSFAVVVNVATGEWGFIEHAGGMPNAGCYATTTLNIPNESIFFGSSKATVYSTTSLTASEEGFAQTVAWRSGPVAADLPGNYKQLTQIDVDYRATSRATLLIQVSQDGGNVYDNTINTIGLPASIAGRATAQVYVGGALPTINIASGSTGFELHRLDVTMALGGRRSG